MGVTLSREQINKVLANANEAAKQDGERLAESERTRQIRDAIRDLQMPTVPRTYLAVTAVLLTARAMFESSDLDVTAIKAGDDPRGYSASSIGAAVSSFAKEHGIDLRAMSQQPMNNQPFTFKPRIIRKMSVQAKHEGAWADFYEVAESINAMTSDEAKEALALLMHLCRRRDVAAVTVKVKSGGKETLDKVAGAVAQFVAENSENGKVGQAFAAAVLDLLYGHEQVVLGDTQDPDATTPGDVQATDSAGVWLWTEVKQKIVSTGDVSGFLKKVQKAGGERVVYFALKNSGYSGNIKFEALEQQAKSLAIAVKVIESPSEALEWYLPLAPGSFATLASGLLERFRARLLEANCSSALVAKFDDLAQTYAVVTSR